MRFGKTVATACSSFAVTNVDDLFVLATFFAEAAAGRSAMTPLTITLGQYAGFTGILIASMIGFGVSFIIPSEPIGLLGLFPLLLGVWKLSGLVIPADEEEGGGGGGGGEAEEQREQREQRGQREETSRASSVKSVLKVAAVTLMNGGDNVGTYIPLFAQARGAEMAVYVVVYLILLGLWCLAAFVALKQQHVLRLAQKYAQVLVPLLYTGIGIYIVAKSQCYPWSIGRIDRSVPGHHGRTIMAVTTTAVLLAYVGTVLWMRLRARKKQRPYRPAASASDSDSARSQSDTDTAAAFPDPKPGDTELRCLNAPRPASSAGLLSLPQDV